MVFDAIYETDSLTDEGYRVIRADSLAEAKSVLSAQIAAEPGHGRYRLHSLAETAASFALRHKAA